MEQAQASAQQAPQIEAKDIKGKPLLEDIYGTAKEFCEEFIMNIKGEPVFRSMGVTQDKTFLLEGGPGLGKSLSIEVLNNTLNAPTYQNMLRKKETTLAVPFIEYSIGKYGTAYINMNSKNFQHVFDITKEISRMGAKTALVLDECDALLGSRKGNVQSHSEDKKLLETIMTNLQVAHDTPNMYVILMTNCPETCDDASIRAGRIDKRIHFNNPNPEERSFAIQKTIDKLNRQAKYSVIRNYDVGNLVELSDEFNYADIESCITQTVRQRAREIIQTRTQKTIPRGYVHQGRLEDTFKQHRFKYHPIERKIGF